MAKLKGNELGMGPAKAIFLGILLLILLAAGWLVYKFFFQTVPPTNIAISAPPKVVVPTSKTYTDKAGIYTVTYPTAWTVTPDDAINLSIQAPLVDPVILTFTPPAPSDSGFGANGQFELIAFKQDPLTILNDAKTLNAPITPKAVQVDGYSAYYEQEVNNSPPSYTDDKYAIYHNGVTIFVTFRVQQGSNSVVQGYDESSELPQFNSIINTIKFLN